MSDNKICGKTLEEWIKVKDIKKFIKKENSRQLMSDENMVVCVAKKTIILRK